MFKGHFITAYLQREIPVDIAVVAADTTKKFRVGELVTLEPADSDAPAYLHVASGDDAATVLTNATHIIAQSDMTLGYGHAKVENGDYRYSDEVAPTITDGKVPNAASETKKVALFAIMDKNDIIVQEVE